MADRLQRLRWRMLAGTAAGLVVGTLVVTAALPSLAERRPFVVVAAAALAALAGAFGPAVVTGLHEWHRRRDEVARRVAAVHSPDPDVSVAWLLHPAKGVVTFSGRERELKQLGAWCDDADAAPVRLITAPGGYGKTRLARRFAELRRARGWTCLAVAPGHEASAVATLRERVSGSMLLIVDYAETRDPTDLATMIAEAADRERGDRVRVLLLARSTGSWWKELAARKADRATLLRSLTTDANVLPLPARADSRTPTDVIIDAVGDFARHLNVATPRALATGADDESAPLLRLHARALLAVLDGYRSPDGRHDVLDEILGHESQYWRNRAHRVSLPLPADERLADTALRHLVGAAALLGADNADQLAGIVRRTPEYSKGQEDTVNAVGRWLSDLYPGGSASDGSDERERRLGTLQPDLLAEHLAVGFLTGCDSDQARAVFTGLASSQAEQALTVLARATAHQPSAANLIDQAMGTDLTVMAMAAIRIAAQFPGLVAGRLAALLANTDAGLSPDQLIGLARAVPYPSMELSQVAVTLTTLIVRHHAGPIDEEDQGEWLNWHVVRLAEAGRRPEALTHSQEAVNLYREAYVLVPARYRVDLVGALEGCAHLLDLSGRERDASRLRAEAYKLRAEDAGGQAPPA